MFMISYYNYVAHAHWQPKQKQHWERMDNTYLVLRWKARMNLTKKLLKNFRSIQDFS